MTNNFRTPPPNIATKLALLNDYKVKRQAEYGELADQLDMLYKDIEAGLFGEQAKTGLFFQHIMNVKTSIEKPDVDTIKAELDELIAQEENNGN